MQEMQVRSLGQEDHLEKEMATHTSILAWEIPWTEAPVGYNPWGCKESDTTEETDQQHGSSHSHRAAGREGAKRQWVRVHGLGSLGRLGGR